MKVMKIEIYLYAPEDTTEKQVALALAGPIGHDLARQLTDAIPTGDVAIRYSGMVY